MIATEASKNKKFAPESFAAADRLLKAVKDKMIAEKGKVDYAALRRNGYSEDLIARLKHL